MKKILNFFFSNDNHSRGHVFSDTSRKVESVLGFILFLILPIIVLVWYNPPICDKFKILKKDKQIIEKLDVEIQKITKMEDSIKSAIANNLIDSLEKTIIFAKVKSIKKHEGFWYTDLETDIKTDLDCMYLCRTEFSDEELRIACCSKCIKIIKYNTDKYISAWYDTIYTPGVKLEKGVTEEFYIKTIAVDSASKIAKNKADSLKTNLIQNSNIESTKNRSIGYDKYSKEYIDSALEYHYVLNMLCSIVIIIYLFCLIIRQIVIKKVVRVDNSDSLWKK